MACPGIRPMPVEKQAMLDVGPVLRHHAAGMQHVFAHYAVGGQMSLAAFLRMADTFCIHPGVLGRETVHAVFSQATNGSTIMAPMQFVQALIAVAFTCYEKQWIIEFAAEKSARFRYTYQDALKSRTEHHVCEMVDELFLSMNLDKPDLLAARLGTAPQPLATGGAVAWDGAAPRPEVQGELLRPPPKHVLLPRGQSPGRPLSAKPRSTSRQASPRPGIRPSSAAVASAPLSRPSLATLTTMLEPHQPSPRSEKAASPRRPRMATFSLLPAEQLLLLPAPGAHALVEPASGELSPRTSPPASLPVSGARPSRRSRAASVGPLAEPQPLLSHSLPASASADSHRPASMRGVPLTSSLPLALPQQPQPPSLAKVPLQPQLASRPRPGLGSPRERLLRELRLEGAGPGSRPGSAPLHDRPVRVERQRPGREARVSAPELPAPAQLEPLSGRAGAAAGQPRASVQPRQPSALGSEPGRASTQPPFTPRRLSADVLYPAADARPKPPAPTSAVAVAMATGAPPVTPSSASWASESTEAELARRARPSAPQSARVRPQVSSVQTDYFTFAIVQNAQDSPGSKPRSRYRTRSRSVAPKVSDPLWMTFPKPRRKLEVDLY